MKKLVVAILFSGLLALFAAILPTIVGLGRSNGIARAAAPSMSGYSITILNPLRLNPGGVQAIEVRIKYACPAPDERVQINVVQGNASGSTTNYLPCNGQQQTLSIEFPPGSFTKGSATATAQIILSDGTVAATTTQRVAIA